MAVFNTPTLTLNTFSLYNPGEPDPTPVFSFYYGSSDSTTTSYGNITNTKSYSFYSTSNSQAKLQYSCIVSTLFIKDSNNYAQVGAYNNGYFKFVDALSNSCSSAYNLKYATFRLTTITMDSCCLKDNSFPYDITTSTGTITNTFVSKPVRGIVYTSIRDSATHNIGNILCFDVTPLPTLAPTPVPTLWPTPSDIPTRSPSQTATRIPTKILTPSQAIVQPKTPLQTDIPQTANIIAEPTKKNFGIPAIMGITVGTLAFIALVVSIIIFSWKFGFRRKIEDAVSESEITDSDEYEYEDE